MKAAWIEQFGGADVIQVGERPDPVRLPGEVLVSLRAATLNHRDIYLRRGEAGRITLPVVLGSDGAGVVAEADASSAFRVGQPVVVYPVLSCGRCINCRNALPHECCSGFGMIGGERDGTHAELVAVPEACLVALPAGLDFDAAAAISLAGLTAWNMVVDVGRVLAGEHALVLGASGGVGVFTVQLLKNLGARVHAVTSRLDKADALRALGADTVLADAPGEVLRFTRALANGGVDVAFNCVGGSTWRYVLPATRAGGRVLVCGTVRAPAAEMDMRQLFYRNVSIIGCSMGKPDSLRQMLELAAGDRSLRLPVDRQIGLSEIAAAHAHMEAGAVIGKIIVRP